MTDASGDQFSLRWDSFHSILSTSFHALLRGEELVDVTLAAEGRFVQAHKLVLSVCSPYFKDLFKANPCQHPIVILKDVGHKELVSILEFMYRGEVSVGQEDLTEFLKTAELLQVKGLTGDEMPGESGQQETKMPPEPPPDPQPVRIKTPSKSPSKVTSPRPITPKPVLKTETTCSQEQVQQPPQKRMRQEPPVLQYNPLQQPPSNSNVTVQQTSSYQNTASTASDVKEVEFVEMPAAKPEPVEIDSDIEEVDAAFDDSSNFSEIFGAHSSQSFEDFSAVGLDGTDGASQSLGNLQEGEQGSIEFLVNAKGHNHILMKGHVYKYGYKSGYKCKNADKKPVVWPCLFRKGSGKCSARIKMLDDRIVTFIPHHNHPPPANLISGMRVTTARQKLLRSLEEDSATPGRD